MEKKYLNELNEDQLECVAGGASRIWWEYTCRDCGHRAAKDIEPVTCGNCGSANLDTTYTERSGGINVFA